MQLSQLWIRCGEHCRLLINQICEANASQSHNGQEVTLGWRAPTVMNQSTYRQFFCPAAVAKHIAGNQRFRWCFSSVKVRVSTMGCIGCQKAGRLTIVAMSGAEAAIVLRKRRSREPVDESLPNLGCNGGRIDRVLVLSVAFTPGLPRCKEEAAAEGRPVEKEVFRGWPGRDIDNALCSRNARHKQEHGVLYFRPRRLFGKPPELWTCKFLVLRECLTPPSNKCPLGWYVIGFQDGPANFGRLVKQSHQLTRESQTGFSQAQLVQNSSCMFRLFVRPTECLNYRRSLFIFQPPPAESVPAWSSW